MAGRPATLQLLCGSTCPRAGSCLLAPMRTALSERRWARCYPLGWVHLGRRGATSAAERRDRDPSVVWHFDPFENAPSNPRPPPKNLWFVSRCALCSGERAAPCVRQAAIVQNKSTAPAEGRSTGKEDDDDGWRRSGRGPQRDIPEPAEPAAAPHGRG